VKVALSVIILASLSGCSAKAPTMRRTVRDAPIDIRYLHDVFVPAYNGPSKANLAGSVDQLEKHLAEFQAFMHDVETGKIPVKQGLKDDWTSVVDKGDSSIIAAYYGRLGPVGDFQKHNHKGLVYAFMFTKEGYLMRAETLKDEFGFDAQGRVREYQCPRNDLK
jgi:hypothetical protein